MLNFRSSSKTLILDSIQANLIQIKRGFAQARWIAGRVKDKDQDGIELYYIFEVFCDKFVKVESMRN